jgi:hypothetical protein
MGRHGRQRALDILNPLESLYDRVAAVRLLAGDVPVEGRIVFTDRGRFPKGRPPHVSRLGSLAEFPTRRRALNAAADRSAGLDEIVAQAS